MKASTKKVATAEHKKVLEKSPRRTSVGELIAVAFDVVGDQVNDVARLLSSKQMRRAMKSHVLFT